MSNASKPFSPALPWVAAGLIAGCSCPTNDSGVAVSPSKYAAERDAARAAVEGCTAEWMADVRVYEVGSKSEVETLCENEQAWACYCYESIGCQTIFLMPNARDNALHEFVHAALDGVDIDTRNHGPLFEKTLAAARANLRAARAAKTQ